MAAETPLSTEERIRQLLGHLGLDQAHFAGWSQQDWTGLVTTYPEVVSSLTVINAFDPRRVEHLAARLLVVTGDQGSVAETMRSAMNRVPAAHHVCLSNYNILGWSDVAAERTGELGDAMLQFLARMIPPVARESGPLREGDGEVAGISYRIRGAGPPWCCCRSF